MSLFVSPSEEDESIFRQDVRAFLDSKPSECLPVDIASSDTSDHTSSIALLLLSGVANFLRYAGKLFSVIAWILQCQIFGLIPLELIDSSESLAEVPEVLTELPGDSSSGLEIFSGLLTGDLFNTSQANSEVERAKLQEKRKIAMINSDRIAKGLSWLALCFILCMFCLPVASSFCGIVVALLFLASDVCRVNYCYQQVYFYRDDKFNEQLNLSVHIWSRNQALLAMAGSFLGIAATMLFFTCPPVGAFFASTLFLGITLKMLLGGVLSLAALLCCIKANVDEGKLTNAREKEKTEGIELTLFNSSQSLENLNDCSENYSVQMP